MKHCGRTLYARHCRRWHLQLPLLSSVGTCSCRCCCRRHPWAPVAAGVVAVGGPGGDVVAAAVAVAVVVVREHLQPQVLSPLVVLVVTRWLRDVVVMW